MADENANETAVLTDAFDLIRAMNSIDGGVPRKEEEEEDDDDVENVVHGSELAAVPTDVYGDTQQRIKKQPQQQQRKRHGARNQHKMKHFVRWLLETFPDILVHPPSSASSAPHQGGNEKNTSSCTVGNSSCCCNAKQQVAQQEEKVEVEPLREETKSSSSCCAENDDEDSVAAVTLAPLPLILDVAGGKGELAARLCLCLHLRVVLVDPRPANIAQAYQQTVVPRLPKKWQERLQQRLATNPNHVQDILSKKFHQVVDYFSFQAVVGVLNNYEHDDDYTKQQQQNVLRLQQAVQDASLLIGMHADGATEDIIDVALRYQKPFVVVPCCVFANLYSHRQVRRVVVPDKTSTTYTTTTKEEQPQEQPQDEQQQQQKLEPLPEMTFASVRTHEQFCQYLLDKDSRFQKSVLPFEGRNVAIWWNGK
jgi:hypothetical protein